MLRYVLIVTTVLIGWFILNLSIGSSDSLNNFFKVAIPILLMTSIWLRYRQGQASRKLRSFILLLAGLGIVVQIAWVQRQPPYHSSWSYLILIVAVVFGIWWWGRKRISQKERIP